jgi:hypothetical protein
MSHVHPGAAPANVDQPLEERGVPFIAKSPILSRASSRRAGALSGPVAWTVGALVVLAVIGSGAAYWVSRVRQPPLFATTTAAPAVQQPASPAASMPTPAAVTPSPAPVEQASVGSAPADSSTLARHEHRAAIRLAKARAAEQSGADVSAVAPSAAASSQTVPSLSPPPAVAPAAPPVLTPPPATSAPQSP